MLFSQAGSLDNSFIPQTNNYTDIRCFTIQTNKKIVIGSNSYIGQPIPVKAIARLNPDGSIDSTFNVPNIFNNFSTFSIAEQSDGKIIVGGWDNNSGEKNYVSRLNPDGSIDSSFDIGLNFTLCPTLKGESFSKFLSKSSIAVLPIIFQPPGLCCG